MSNPKESTIKRKSFTGKIESFTCEVCGTKVKGTGYTNHCPDCLWSRHVDFFPGDRETDCGGLMEPIGAIQSGRKWRVFYRCQKCGYERLNNTSPDDNFQKIVELSVQPVTSTS